MPIVQNLIADQFGSHVGKYSQRLKVTQKKEVLAQAPLLHLESVTIASNGVSISADAIRACTERGIPIHFLSSRGAPYASLYSADLLGAVLTRRAQLSAYRDARALRLAAALARGKMENQAALLKYVAKYRKEKAPDVYRELRLLATEIGDHLGELDDWLQIGIREAALIDETRPELLSIEGRAAQKYWRGIKQVLPESLAWPGRRRRGATDPFNSALNYGYGILYSQVERSLVLAGLDPYGGYIHTDRPGKPSLVLDLIEPFRAPVVDRTILGLVNRNVTIEQEENGRLSKKTRRQLAEKVLARLEAKARHKGKRHALRAILQMQARSLAAYVRGERDDYHPFLASW
jgi:CRISPR-associated protein Cas1